MILRYNILPILWAFFIGIISLMPGENMPEISFLELFSVDKLAHAFVYGMLVFLLTTGLKRQYTNGWLRYHAKLAAFWTGVFYGLLLEIMQLILNNERYFELWDVVANAVGCLLGIISFMLIFGKELSR